MKKLIITTFSSMNNEIERQIEFFTLKKKFSEKRLNHKVVALIDYGTANGDRVNGYRILDNLHDVLNLFNTRNGEWYIEDNDLVSVQVHNGGINYIKFRELKDNNDARTVCELQYKEKITGKDITKYTTSLKGVVEEIMK